MNAHHPLARLRHHVSGAIARGEATPIMGQPATRHMYVTAMEARGLARGLWPSHAWSLATIMRKLGAEVPTFLLHADDRVSRYHAGRVTTYKARSPEAIAHWTEARDQRA